MAITMLDLAALEKPSIRKAFMDAMFIGELPSPMDILPVENASSLSQQVVRVTDAGSPTTRNIGGAVVAYQAKFTDGQETLKIIENKVVIDKVLLDVKNYVQDPIEAQMKIYAQTVRATVNNLFINGDPGATDSEPAGLTYRLTNDAMFLNQTINAAGLDVDNNDLNRNAWLDYIDQAISLVRGQADAVIVNRQTHLKLRSALRNLKVLDTTRDQYDRELMTYGKTRIYDAGMKPAGLVTGVTTSQVILNDGSTSIFGTASTTPMFFINTRASDGVRLLQLHPLRVSKLGIDPGSPADFVTDVTWPIGFLTPIKFCITSIQGLDIT